MADYFTYFSFNLPVKDDGQKEYALSIAQTASTHRFESDNLPDDFPTQLKAAVEDWAFEVEAQENRLWLHSESGGIDAVCAFVQYLLQKFDLAPSVAFEWSFDCSAPRVGAFGGGAAVITKTAIKSITTSEWVRSKTARVSGTKG